MKPMEYAWRGAPDVDKAREDSLALWRHLDAAPASAGVERRPLNLSVRYQVGDGNEFAGEVPELTALGFALKGPRIGRVGEWCLANIATLGIVEGVVVQSRQQSFVTGIVAPPSRLRRLAERLNWKLRHDSGEAPERRVHERVEMNAAEGRLATADGQSYPCRVFDVSEGGAALHLGGGALYFWADQPVTFEGRAATVLRIFPGGVVIKYE
jgi:hypothetical protein